MLNDNILNSLVAQLNGDTVHMDLEDLYVSRAVLDGETIVMTFESFNVGTVPFRARFALMDIELATSAELRRPAGA